MIDVVMQNVYFKLIKAGRKTLEEVPSTVNAEVKILVVKDWYNQIITGEKTLDDVPENLRTDVQQLIDNPPTP